MSEKTRWTIAVSIRVNNYGYGQKRNVEWTNVRLEEVPLAEYRGNLALIDEAGESEKEWTEVLASGSITVTPAGMQSLMELCRHNINFMVEFEKILVKIWYMGRAYERIESMPKKVNEVVA